MNKAHEKFYSRTKFKKLHVTRTLFRNIDEQGKIHWNLWVKLLSEALGTFLLVFWICLPSVLAFGSVDALDSSGVATHWAHGNQGLTNFANSMNTFFAIPFMGPIYVAVGILLIIIGLIHISANLNPVVTLMEIKRKEDTHQTAFFKIATQFGFAFLAAYCLLIMSQGIGTWGLTTNFAPGVNEFNYIVNIDSIQPQYITYTYPTITAFEKTDVSNVGFWFGSILMEMLLVTVLLGFVFIGKMSKQTRVFIIFGGIVLIVFMGLFLNTIALNPARLIAPAVFNDIGRAGMDANSSSLYTQWLWIYLIGEFLAVFLFGMLDDKYDLANIIDLTKQTKTSKNK